MIFSHLLGDNDSNDDNDNDNARTFISLSY